MFCSKCGTQLDDSSVFCSKCGAQVALPAGPAADVSPKSRLAATLLACPFLGVGMFGAHRFYMGKIKSAVGLLLLGLGPIICGAAAVAVMFASDPEAETPPVMFFVLYGLAYALGIAAFIWSVVDFIIAVTGGFKDTQGRPISKW